MKNWIFLIVGVSIVILIAFPVLGVSIIVLGGFMYIARKFFRKEQVYSGPIDDCADIRLPFPGPSYSYYEMVGMKFRNLDKSDYGIHDCALAVSENNNPYDPYAVGIYRTDGGFLKLVGYIPSDMNEELHDYINKYCGGRTPATYKIWRRGDKIYGITYIKDKD